MPPLVSNYTFADFLLRLQRSPSSHMSLIYHKHSQLFRGRPDMFTKAVLSVSWERSLALLDAAYHSQPIAVETYDGVLRRMLLHNKHVSQTGAGQVVGWKPAMHVFSEAIFAHGNAVPTHLLVSTLRLLAPHRRATTALQILRFAQANERLTKAMLVDAAHACAGQAHWAQSLHLLTHLHRDDPSYLTAAIQSLRPVGTDVVSVQDAQHSVLSNPRLARPNATQWHILCVLNDVVSSVPWEVAVRDELCHSYLSHLTASTVLSVEEKVQALRKAVRQLPWDITMLFLRKYTEPNLLSSDEWEQLNLELPDPSSLKLKKITVKGGSATISTTKGRSKGKLKKMNHNSRGEKRRKAAGDAEKAPEEGHLRGLEADAQKQSGICPTSSHEITSSSELTKAPDSSLDCTVSPKRAWAFVSRHFLASAGASPCLAAPFAALIAVLVAKLPNAAAAIEFLEAAPSLIQYVEMDETPTASSSSSIHMTTLRAALAHPAVRLALLEKCVGSPQGEKEAKEVEVKSKPLQQEEREKEGKEWRGAVLAARWLLSSGQCPSPTPTRLLSPLIRQLRAEKEVSLAVRLLREHLVPTRGTLTRQALEDLFECILAHNLTVHTVAHAMGKVAKAKEWQMGEIIKGEEEEGAVAQQQARDHLDREVVHWKSALSWAVDLAAPSSESRIVATGSGPSQGAVARRPAVVLQNETPLSARMLSLLLSICVDACSPQGALYAMGYARRVSKVELAFSEEIRALLYCLLYDRPYEAEVLVTHAEEKHGGVAAAPLRRLLNIGRAAKQRQSYDSD